MSPVIWHHMMVDSDEYPHVFGKPTECWCEPEVSVLDAVHRMVTHQDMSGKPQEVRYGAR